MTRQDGRAYDELRPIKITTDFVKFPEGSCLIECGDTKVLCCASIEDKTPPHVAEGEGWVTAEYSMLPRANRERSKRDIAKLKLSPRSAEIQRLVGRSLRAAVDMQALGERTINIDCDVLQGDGGTRTASVTGGFVALALACRKLVEEGYLGSTPIRHFVTGVSAGIVDEQRMLDLQYSEDSRAQVDLNCVMNELGEIIEIAGHRRGPGLYSGGAAGAGAAVRQGQPGTAENSEGSTGREAVMKFVLATHNPNKIREMGAILGQFGVEVVSPKDLGITVDVEETGTTFAENAMLKAKAICEAGKAPGHCRRFRPMRGRPQRRPRRVFRPVRRRGTGRQGPVYPAAAKSPGPDHPGGPLYLLYRLRLPQWRHHHRRGAGSPAPSPLPPWGRTASVMTRCFSCRKRPRPLPS